MKFLLGFLIGLGIGLGLVMFVMSRPAETIDIVEGERYIVTPDVPQDESAPTP